MNTHNNEHACSVPPVRLKIMFAICNDAVSMRVIGTQCQHVCIMAICVFGATGAIKNYVCDMQ